MFVVGTVQRVANPDDTTKFNLVWPVVFEDEEAGFIGGVVAKRESRDAADKVADALNKALEAN